MKRFKRILCYAGTDNNEVAINRAITLAIENSASLTLMDVVKPIPRALGMVTDVADPKELEELVAKDHREKLLKRASEYIDTGVPIDVMVSVGDPACEIVRQVVADKHDLVVKAADGLSSVGRLFGSITRALLRICPCPVWILKPEIHDKFDQVVAAVDMEADDQAHQELNRTILELAFSIAQKENADLHVVSAWDLWMEKSLRRRAGDAETDAVLAQHETKVHKALDDLLQAPKSSVANVHTHIQRGFAPRVIQMAVDKIEADLLVMGTVCRTGVSGFLIGNTAETILADVTCSVLALKPEGYVSPVELSDMNADVLTEPASQIPR